jgi:hypothetical protein
MRLLPLLLTLVVGVALWAAPTPGEGVSALGDGYELCPPNLNNCTNYSQAHHHIDDASGAYNTDVLDIHSCGMVTVCLAFVEVVKENADTVPLQILADVNGDGVINLADEVPLDGDDGSDNDGDNTARQTACMYGITGNKMQMAVQNGGGGANEEAYLEVSCR